MAKQHKKFIKQITKRRDWLATRMKTSDKVLSYDKVEHDALSWVINELVPLAKEEGEDESV